MDSLHHDHDNDDGGCSSHHAMVFHIGVCQEILFNGWMSTTAWQLFGSAVAIFVAAVLYEGLKYYRESLHGRMSPSPCDSRVNIIKTEGGASSTPVVKYSITSPGHMVQTGLHAVQSTVSYLLMLVFMTYNTWLCLALVLGLTLGYFLFGWRRTTAADLTEHCQ